MPKINKYFILFLLVCKILAGFLCYSVYKYHYDWEKSDLQRYFNDGKILYDIKNESFVDFLKITFGFEADNQIYQNYIEETYIWNQPDNYGMVLESRTYVRLHALLMFVSQGNIYFHIIFFALLSFIGSYVLFLALYKYLNINKYLLLSVLFLLPSCLFWSSALLKESLIWFSLGLIFYFFTKLLQKFNLLIFIALILSVYLMILAKTAIILPTMTALIFLLISNRLSIKQQLIAFGIYAVCGIIIFLLIDNFFLQNKFLNSIVSKQHKFLWLIDSLQDSGSSFSLSTMDFSYYSLFSMFSEALNNCIFRPYISDLKNPLLIITFIENCCLFIFIVLPMVFFKKPTPESLKIILFCVIFVVIHYFIIGCITANLGGLVRYKTTAQPFFLLIFIVLTDWKKIIYVNRWRNMGYLTGLQ